MTMVRDQPWTGYNWYDGGYRSRVDINLDLPLRLPGLVGVTAHETYPGHHLEHALKEQTLVEELGRLEASVLLINTPECLISEGLANVGKAIAVPVAERADLLVELAPLAGAPARGGRGPSARGRGPPGGRHRRARDPRRGARQRRADAPRGRPAATGGPRLPHRGRPVRAGHGEEAARVQRAPVVADLRVRLCGGRDAPPALARRLAGEDRPARFARLLHEPLTPPAIEAEIAADTPDAA